MCSVSKENINFDKDMIDEFIKIGFIFYRVVDGTHENCIEYKYYPKYYKDKHYTLVFYAGDDYRLYTHRNIDGHFIDSPFQISTHREYGRVRLIEKLSEVFKEEFLIINRKNKIDNLIN